MHATDLPEGQLIDAIGFSSIWSLTEPKDVCPICGGCLDCGRLPDGRFGCEGLIGEKKELVRNAMKNKVNFNGSSD